MRAISAGLAAAKNAGTPIDPDTSAQELITECQQIIDQADSDALAIQTREMAEVIANSGGAGARSYTSDGSIAASYTDLAAGLLPLAVFKLPVNGSATLDATVSIFGFVASSPSNYMTRVLKKLLCCSRSVDEQDSNSATIQTNAITNSGLSFSSNGFYIYAFGDHSLLLTDIISIGEPDAQFSVQFRALVDCPHFDQDFTLLADSGSGLQTEPGAIQYAGGDGGGNEITVTDFTLRFIPKELVTGFDLDMEDTGHPIGFGLYPNLVYLEMYLYTTGGYTTFDGREQGLDPDKFESFYLEGQEDLVSIDLHGFSQLTSFDVWFPSMDALETVDISGTAVEELVIYGGISLATLNLSNISGNPLFDIGDFDELDELNLTGTAPTEISLYNLPSLAALPDFDKSAIFQITLDNLDLPTLVDLSHCTAITNLYLYGCDSIADVKIVGCTSLVIAVASNCSSLPPAKVSRILIDLDNNGLSDGTVQLDGTTPAPDSSSDDAVASLLDKGWSVTTN